VSLTEKVQAEVSLHFVGSPPGVKEGGILSPIKNEVEIEALPSEIPAFIEVDVSHLNINDDIRVRDLPVIEGVVILDDPEDLLVTVTTPVAEVEVVPEVEEAEEGAETEEGGGEEADDSE
jgi:large subunit ribosomal protein L25